MKKKGFLYINDGMFPYDIVVCLGVKREEILAYFDKKFKNGLTDRDKEEIVMKGLGRTIELDNNAVILWTKEVPIKPNDFGVLVHEIFHACDLILRHNAGVKLCDESDEVWAYKIGWLTTRIFKAYKL